MYCVILFMLVGNSYRPLMVCNISALKLTPESCIYSNNSLDMHIVIIYDVNGAIVRGDVRMGIGVCLILVTFSTR